MRQEMPTDRPGRTDRSLKVILWAAWFIAIAATAYLTWHDAEAAHHHVSRIALAIHCALVGCIGMLVITWVEIRVAHH
jgi:hypothetical protein